MNRLILLLLVLLTAAASVGAQQSAEPEPVPSTMLQGGRIAIPECRCSLETPTEGEWVWFRQSGSRLGTAFYSVIDAEPSEDSRSFDVMVTAHARPSNFPAQWKSAVPTLAAARHASVANLKIQTTRHPRAGSYHFSYVETSAEGRKTFTFGYAVNAANHLVQLEQSGPWQAELPIFTKLVASLARTD